MAKYRGYNVDFSLHGLSMIEQEKVYCILMEHLSFDQKDKLEIKVTDPIGGIHDIHNENGIDPDGVECKKCIGIDCGSCVVYNRRKELNRQKKEKEEKKD